MAGRPGTPRSRRRSDRRTASRASPPRRPAAPPRPADRRPPPRRNARRRQRSPAGAAARGWRNPPRSRPLPPATRGKPAWSHRGRCGVVPPAQRHPPRRPMPLPGSRQLREIRAANPCSPWWNPVSHRERRGARVATRDEGPHWVVAPCQSKLAAVPGRSAGCANFVRGATRLQPAASHLLAESGSSDSFRLVDQREFTAAASATAGHADRNLPRDGRGGRDGGDEPLLTEPHNHVEDPETLQAASFGRQTVLCVSIRMTFCRETIHFPYAIVCLSTNPGKGGKRGVTRPSRFPSRAHIHEYMAIRCQTIQ